MSVIEIFGHMPDGTPVERVTLRGGGLSANLLTYGSVLQDLRLDGHASPLVLGFDGLENYLAHSRYFGATAGRCANRIANGTFTLDGTAYQLDRNYLGKHQLHGGSRSIGKRIWSFADVSETSATLTIDLADGEMGYPGAMRIDIRYALFAGGTLDIRMRAETDRATLCNLAHHSYFNLSGAPDILDHRLQVAADHYLPVDADLIPTGEIAVVAGTGMDFRDSKRLRAACAAAHIDHNFCLSRERMAIRDVASLTGGDMSMTLRTTEAGLQVFDGAPLDVPVPGLDGRMMARHAGIALEPQVWPDAIHHTDWPQAILRPGDVYMQHTQYIFMKAGSSPSHRMSRE